MRLSASLLVLPTFSPLPVLSKTENPATPIPASSCPGETIGTSQHLMADSDRAASQSVPTLLCGTARQCREAGIRYDTPSSRGQGAQTLGTPGNAGSGYTFLPVPHRERIGPLGFRRVRPAGGRSIRRAGLCEGRGYPASTRRRRWSRARVLVSVGRQTLAPACTPPGTGAAASAW